MLFWTLISLSLYSFVCLEMAPGPNLGASSWRSDFSGILASLRYGFRTVREATESIQGQQWLGVWMFIYMYVYDIGSRLGRYARGNLIGRGKPAGHFTCRRVYFTSSAARTSSSPKSEMATWLYAMLIAQACDTGSSHINLTPLGRSSVVKSKIVPPTARGGRRHLIALGLGTRDMLFPASLLNVFNALTP